VQRNRLIPVLLAFATCIVLSPVLARGADAGPLKIGVARVDTTPTDLTGLTNLWRKPFAGVHDHLYARALVIDNGTSKAAIVATDLVEFGDTTSLRQRIEKEVGIPADRIILTASHDHSAPRGGTVTPGATAQVGGAGTAAYSAWLYDRIVEALTKAKAAEQPARMGIGTGRAYVNISRDEFSQRENKWRLGINPDGPSEKTVWVVKFETPAGDPIAVLFNYGVHSVVAGPENDQVTGDLAGAAERYVEAHYSDKVVALFTIGAAGDQNPTFLGPGQAKQEAAPIFPTMDAEGLMLGAEVVRVANRIENPVSTARIAGGEKIISCPTKPRQATAGQSAEQAPDIKIHLGLIMVNDIAFTGVSGEVVTNILWHLKKASPLTNTIMITMSNDRIGYIVDDAAYGRGIFELSGSPLASGCAENGIVDGLVGLIEANK
jgi:hypothetical protein